MFQFAAALIDGGFVVMLMKFVFVLIFYRVCCSGVVFIVVHCLIFIENLKIFHKRIVYEVYSIK